jgi:hypothetical protein
MKLFQQLLVAPAALGLLASGANAAELNINGVSDYAASADQVTSVTQFSDVYPTDWAYQALSNLVEQYGCVAGYPNGTFRGNRAMTRYEAAALLNACLDRVTEVTDELRRETRHPQKNSKPNSPSSADALTASKLVLANWKQPSSPPPPSSYATAYPSDLLLDFFTYAGGTTTTNLAGAGAGAGAVYEFAPGFTLSGNYVAYSGGE